jgi:hypothetical protein
MCLDGCISCKNSYLYPCWGLLLYPFEAKRHSGRIVGKKGAVSSEIIGNNIPNFSAGFERGKMKKVAPIPVPKNKIIFPENFLKKCEKNAKKMLT